MFKRTVVSILLFLGPGVLNAQWTQWRGSADGQGIVEGKAPVTEWSQTKNVIWKSPVHGIGGSSPVISQGKIFLTSADPKLQKFYLICYDQQTGRQLWERIAFWGKPLENLHKQNTHASASPATDGEVVTVLFGVKDALRLAAFTLDGKKLWQTEVANVRSKFGTGTSPVIYKDRVIVMNDMPSEQMIAAYRLKDGKLLWKHQRNDGGKSGLNSYSTPRVFNILGNDRIVATGLEKVVFYDPESGKVDWEIATGPNVTVGTPVINRRFLYINGGWPQNGATAIDLRRREVVWKNRFNTYISSMVFYNDLIFGSTNRGEIACMDAKNGTILWRKRLREDVQASPYIAGKKLYITLRNGVTKVIEPSSEKYIEVSENKIRGITDATPAVVDGLIYYRGDDTLYCIGES